MSTTRLLDHLKVVVKALAEETVRADPREVPKYRFDGVEVKTAKDVAALLGISVVEAKARIRRVRTPEGARKYGQPIGSIIIADLEAVSDLKKNPPKWKRDGGGDYVLDTGRFKGSIRKYGRFYEVRITDQGDGTGNAGLDLFRTTARSYKDAKDLALAYMLKREGSELVKKRSKPKSEKRFVDNYWGVYGKDWVYEDDSEADLPEWDESDWEARRQWAMKETDNYRVQAVGQPLNPRYQELFNAVLSVHDAQYPGFQNMVGMLEVDNSVPNAYAWNRVLTPRNIEGMIERDWRATTAVGYNARMYAGRAINHAGAEAIRSGTQDGHGHWATRYSQLKKSFPDLDDDQIQVLRTTTHELGHTVGRIVFNEVDPYAAIFSTGDEDANYYREFFWWEGSEILEKYGIADGTDAWNAMSASGGMNSVRLNTGAMRAALSGYAGTNLHEMLAEVWAEYQLDPEPRGFALEMGALMEKTLEEYLYWEADNHYGPYDAIEYSE
jgi:hypothetical protein